MCCLLHTSHIVSYRLTLSRLELSLMDRLDFLVSSQLSPISCISWISHIILALLARLGSSRLFSLVSLVSWISSLGSSLSLVSLLSSRFSWLVSAIFSRLFTLLACLYSSQILPLVSSLSQIYSISSFISCLFSFLFSCCSCLVPFLSRIVYLLCSQSFKSIFYSHCSNLICLHGSYSQLYLS